MNVTVTISPRDPAAPAALTPTTPEPSNRRSLGDPVEIRLTTPGERLNGIVDGREALAVVIATETLKLKALRELQRVVEAAYKGDPSLPILRDSKAIAAFDRGIDVLEHDYCEGGSTESMIELSDIASRAEISLGIAGGQRRYARGGLIDHTDQPHIAYRVRDLAGEIKEYGLAKGSAPL